jgi:hypothetical protein
MSAEFDYWLQNRLRRAFEYSDLHNRVRRERGSASAYECEHADETCKGRIEWANISHEYKDVEDFMPLGASHHHRHDRHNQAAA